MRAATTARASPMLRVGRHSRPRFRRRRRVSTSPRSRCPAFGLTSSAGERQSLCGGRDLRRAQLAATDKLGDLTLALHGSYDREAISGRSAVRRRVDKPVGRRLQRLRRANCARVTASAKRCRRGSSSATTAGSTTATTDALGYLRNSTGYAGKAGVTFDISKLLTGEASFGYGERGYQDPRLPSAPQRRSSTLR